MRCPDDTYGQVFVSVTVVCEVVDRFVFPRWRPPPPCPVGAAEPLSERKPPPRRMQLPTAAPAGFPIPRQSRERRPQFGTLCPGARTGSCVLHILERKRTRSDCSSHGRRRHYGRGCVGSGSQVSCSSVRCIQVDMCRCNRWLLPDKSRHFGRGTASTRPRHDRSSCP